jgi:pilus assembly protein Flp/PilA
MKAIMNFIREEEGVTAIEYALIAALIAIVIVVGVSAAGVSINNLFNKVATCVASPATGC